MDIASFNALLTVINKFFIVSNKIDKTLKRVREVSRTEQDTKVAKPARRKRINQRIQKNIKDF